MTESRKRRLIEQIERALKRRMIGVAKSLRTEREIRAYYREHLGVVYVREYTVGAQLREIGKKPKRKSRKRSPIFVMESSTQSGRTTHGNYN